MKYFISYAIIVAVCIAVAGIQAKLFRKAVDDIHQISSDIHAIRETLEPKSLTFGVEPPPFRARVDFRENSYTGVTLL